MDHIEERILQAIEENKEEIIEIGRRIWAYPELGYKEYVTSEYFADFCRKQGLRVETGYAVTGVKAYLSSGPADAPTIALIGEMDALPMPDSPWACQSTGAAHTCGHNAQMAGIMGALLGLASPEIRDALGGNIVFFAVPAEEFIEIEFKRGLMEEGRISFGGGKSELIRIGAFDDIDLAVANHMAPKITAALSNHISNGFMNKVVRFSGRASHAAEAPDKGIDALSAANLAMTAINCQRESFREEDTVRIHGFISRGGEAMSIIADETTMEYSVRANNIPAILDAEHKFDRSIRAAAIATGCAAELVTMAGYLPVVPREDCAFLEEALEEAAGSYGVSEPNPDVCKKSSTDLGEVSQLLPVYQFNTGGFEGALHERGTHPVDEYLAYVVPAKIFALSAYKLLKDGAACARRLVDGFTPSMTKAEYIAYMEEHTRTEIIRGEFEQRRCCYRPETRLLSRSWRPRQIAGQPFAESTRGRCCYNKGRSGHSAQEGKDEASGSSTSEKETQDHHPRRHPRLL